MAEQAIQQPTTGIKVNETTECVNDMLINWEMIRDLLAGTKSMRKNCTRYVPKRTMEEQEDYMSRVKVATLFPALKETISKLVGRAFAEPMIMNDDVATWISGDEDCVCDDIDMQGRSVHVFARDVFRTGMSYGMSCVLIDAPPAVTAEGAPALSVADQKNAKLRPYCIEIHPMRILGWIERDGTLVQLRIWGSRTETTEFGETSVPQVWVYTVGNRADYEKSNDGQWRKVSDTPMGIDVIPFVAYYTNRTGFMQAEPPLLELAYLNAKHFSKQSDLDELIKTAEVPILVEYGGGETSTIRVGAKSAVKLGDYTTCRLEYCEHTGAAIGAGREDLEALKEEMRDAGAKLLQRGQAMTNAKTATQVNEEAAADNSILGAMIQDYEDFWSQVLDLVAQWGGVDDGGTVELQPNLDPDMSPLDSMKLLLDMNNSGKLSDETLYEEVQKRGLINDERPWEDESTRIKNQMPTTPPPVNIDPVTGKPLAGPPVPTPTPPVGSMGV